MIKRTEAVQAYFAPEASVTEFWQEQCIATSPGADLDDLGYNPIYSEDF